MKEIQKRLKNSGYYIGEIDGVWGPLTQSALYKALGIEYVKSHFNDEEFRCTCRGKYCNGFPAPVSQHLKDALEEIRRENGDKPVNITSGVRCRERNREVGGVRNSYHLKGQAADFVISGTTAFAICQKIGTRYLETYAIDENAVHIAVK